ncbi:hypothetical protein, partial [Cryobacterium mannosilyticum]|uniref:hypothetical protein n=1 Tax=Cryobacterium mannosilyticum TaxID=1259190 RepID=UPI001A7E3334
MVWQFSHSWLAAGFAGPMPALGPRRIRQPATAGERVDYWRLAIEASAQSHVGCRWAGVGAGDRAL